LSLGPPAPPVTPGHPLRPGRFRARL